MIKLMIVAGDSSDKLANFLEQRGTFSVECSFPDLSNIEGIHDKIIKVDKFLYLYRQKDTITSIKNEMQTLQQLLSGGSFFSPGEIIFIVRDEDDSVMALKYFKSVMQNCNYEDYSIKRIKGILSFSAIYDAIMGTSEVKDFKNQYRRVYRVERNGDSNTAYLPHDDKTLVVEPFTYDEINDYERRKQTAVKIDTGFMHTDNRDSDVDVFDNPLFNRIEYDDSIMQQRVILITGGSNSGKSVWTTALAASAVASGMSALILDYTQNQDIIELCNSLQTPHKEVSFKELLVNSRLEPGTLNVCRFANVRERGVRMEFLQNFITRIDPGINAVLVATELCDYDQADKLLSDVLSTRIYTVTPLRCCIMSLLEILDKHKQEKRVVILNQAVKLMNGMEFVDTSMIRDMIDNQVRLVKPVFFDNLEKGKKIYATIVGDQYE